MRRYLVFVFSLSALLSLGSCAPTVVTKVHSPVSGHEAEDERVVLDASGSKSNKKSSKKSWVAAAAEAEKNDDIYTKLDMHRGDIDIDASKFTSAEMLYPSTAIYDPFGSDNIFVLDLKELKKEFTYPVPGKGYRTSPYGPRSGRMHYGVDLKADKGDDICAAFDGVVRVSRYISAYGNVITIRHYNGLETTYSHNTRNKVKVGDEVKSGDVIALAGSTGRATGVHLHFELRVVGQAINPELLLDIDNRSILSNTLYIYRKGTTIAAAHYLPYGFGGKKDSADEKAESKSESKSETTAKQSSSKAVYHTIKSGDTLYALALKYKTTVAKICSLNKITEKTTLKLGRKLRIK